MNPPPRPPSDGTFDDDILTPGNQTFDDYATATTTPTAADLLQIRNVVTFLGNTGGINVLADRDSVSRGDTVDFVSPGIQSGIQTFPGGVPLYRGNQLIGAVGVSGDGVDEDDLVAFTCSEPYQPPPNRKIDAVTEADIAQVLIAKAEILAQSIEAHPDPVIQSVFGPLFRTERNLIADRFSRGLAGVRIPYVKFPRKPDDK